jgi:hypothetical protein
MDWQIVFTSALVSGVVSSIIGLIVSTRLKSIDFRFNYKKYILDKRVGTYEKIERVINDFQSDHPNASNPASWFTEPSPADMEALQSFERKIADVTASTIWIEPNTLECLNKIEATLYLLREEKSEQKKLDTNDIEEYKRRHLQGDEDFFKFGQRYTELVANYFRDISQLDNVESFIKRQSKAIRLAVGGMETLVKEAGERRDALTTRPPG